jgi:hypothetical protein
VQPIVHLIALGAQLLLLFEQVELLTVEQIELLQLTHLSPWAVGAFSGSCLQGMAGVVQGTDQGGALGGDLFDQ